MNSPKITNILLSLLVLVVLTLVFVATPSFPQKAQPVSTSAGYQRFLPIRPESPPIQGIPPSNHFALDTETGQLCKSFPWNFQSNPFNQIPVCRDLIER